MKYQVISALEANCVVCNSSITFLKTGGGCEDGKILKWAKHDENWHVCQVATKCDIYIASL